MHTRDEQRVSEEPVLRYQDYRLDDEQVALQNSYRAFLSHECTIERVRSSEPFGFDADLWQALCSLGTMAMAANVESGGDGASLVDLALVAEEFGRRAAPVPLADAMVGLRALLSIDSSCGGSLDQLLTGDLIATLSPGRGPGAQLVPAGAVANIIVGCSVGNLVRVDLERQLPHVRNHADAPMAWCDPQVDGSATIVSSGAEGALLFERAVREWKLLTAASLVGIGTSALESGIAFAQERVAFGRRIGSFQAVSHSLVDAATHLESARNLTRKAAWHLERNADESLLVSMAFAHASRAAGSAVAVGVHVQGGLGFTLESDQQLYFRRAKGWSLAAGDPRRELVAIGEELCAGRHPGRLVEP